MAEIKIKVELSEQDRALLEKLIAHLNVSGTPFQAPETETPAEDPKPKKAPKAKEEAPAAEPVEEEPKAEEPKQEAPASKTYTLEDVRSRVMGLSRVNPETKAEVKKILNKYAVSVPQLTPDQYAPFMTELEALSVLPF